MERNASRLVAQLDLMLAPPRRWGGRGAGGGRKPGARRPVPDRPRLWVAQHFPAHVTVKVRAGIPSLRAVSVVRAVERSFRESCDLGTFASCTTRCSTTTPTASWRRRMLVPLRVG